MPTSEPDPLAVFRGLDLTGIEPARDMAELAQRSILASRERVPDVSAPAEVMVRLSGEGIRRNRIDARKASLIIGHIQEVFSAIGQALSGSPTAKGPIPALIRQRTALNFFPVPTAGSVKFWFEAPFESSTATAEFPMMAESSLADQAAAALVEIMDKTNLTLEVDDLVGRLRTLGPRAARQIQRLASDLVSDDINLDLTWRKFGEPPTTGSLPYEYARRLRDAIKSYKVDVQEVTLVGTLVTVSRVQRSGLVLDSGETISLNVEEGLVGQLGQYFDQRVRVTTEESVTHHEATGRDVPSYRLLTIGLASEAERGDDIEL